MPVNISQTGVARKLYWIPAHSSEISPKAFRAFVYSTDVIIPKIEVSSISALTFLDVASDVATDNVVSVSFS